MNNGYHDILAITLTSLAHIQWRSQKFRSGRTRLKDKIESKKNNLKKLIKINNKICNCHTKSNIKYKL